VTDPIVRIAAKGDGVAASGKHIVGAVTGDWLDDSGVLHAGPHRQTPPCRHFPECGGCQLQHVDDAAYAGFCGDRVRFALKQHDIESEVRPALLSPPRSRRRTTLRFVRAGGRVLLGFNASRSNRIIDILECHILRPELFALLAPLRGLIGRLGGKAGEVQLTLADQGADVMLKGVRAEGLEAAEAVPAFAETHCLARLSIDEGYGAEPRYEPQRVTVTLGGRPVPLPVGAFLQATGEGEAALVAAVREAVGEAQRPLDLFAGLGTFALALAGRVTAAEASRDAVLALKQADPEMDAQHRDLYRRPFDAKELAAFDAVVLDPPRSGAEEQVRTLAASALPRIAYVSCNPATFARDAAILTGSGYRLEWVQPVGQFLWSTHVELAAAFSR
jgi:23S rRNA (uracil1939-C5)-methyltransferase